MKENITRWSCDVCGCFKEQEDRPKGWLDHYYRTQCGDDSIERKFISCPRCYNGLYEPPKTFKYILDRIYKKTKISDSEKILKEAVAVIEFYSQEYSHDVGMPITVDLVKRINDQGSRARRFLNKVRYK